MSDAERDAPSRAALPDLPRQPLEHGANDPPPIAQAPPERKAGNNEVEDDDDAVVRFKKTIESEDYASWGSGKAVGVSGKAMWGLKKVLDGMDFIGEVFADFFGITDSRYQYVVDAHDRHVRQVASEQKEHELEAQRAAAQREADQKVEDARLRQSFAEQARYEQEMEEHAPRDVNAIPASRGAPMPSSDSPVAAMSSADVSTPALQLQSPAAAPLTQARLPARAPAEAPSQVAAVPPRRAALGAVANDMEPVDVSGAPAGRERLVV